MASGSGTILRAMVEAGLEITSVLVDRPCGAIDIARSAGIEVDLVERTDFGASFDRVEYSEQVADVLGRRGIELVAMAGFGTILAEPVHGTVGGQILNTHPALLPSFPGWHAVAEAVAYGVRVTGCTVHVATVEVDHGPILAQQAVSVAEGDTEETLHERIKVVERDLYPATLSRVMADPGVLERAMERWARYVDAAAPAVAE